MPSSESPERGPSYPHDPLQVIPNSPRIVACNTQDPTTPPDELPPLEEGATGPGPSSPSTTSSDGSLEGFPSLPVLQNDNHIPIDPAILANGRPWEASSAVRPTITKAVWRSLMAGMRMLQRINTLTSRLVHNCTPPTSALRPMHPAPAVWVKALAANSRGVSSEEQRDWKNRPQSSLELLLHYLPIPSFTVRSHFLSLQLDERLQFLSWLFEGALASCTTEFNEGAKSAACLDDHGEIGPTRHGHSKRRKGHGGKLSQWSPEDGARLLSMIEDRQPWPEIARCFLERTESALRQRLFTLRKRRNRSGLDPAESATNTPALPVVI
uniref:Myb-like domain-containing protein n=1 Tax=Coccidioides posadasii RMSCC 3488 TaxID=454284 RepID=A0A0J6I694_COCPO|nr:hypothetical protein CPAG_03273 [Coccidioides posadasii RMSCC 3488]